jgi:hypothetical protein
LIREKRDTRGNNDTQKYKCSLESSLREFHTISHLSITNKIFWETLIESNKGTGFLSDGWLQSSYPRIGMVTHFQYDDDLIGE